MSTRNRATRNWPEQVRGAVDCRPTYLALDAVGGSLIDDLAAVLADGGTIVSYGALGTGSPDVRRLVPRELGLHGVSMTSIKGTPAFGVYATTKAALRSFART
jgi:NADPH:quinone reductase-like Zn-dependent oxidoreductase